MLGLDGAGPESHPISSIPIVRPSNQTFRKGGGGGLSRFVSEVQDLGILLRLGLFRCGRSLGPAASVCPASGGCRAITRGLGRRRRRATMVSVRGSPTSEGGCVKPMGTGCGRPSGREDGGHGERAAECVRGAASVELRDPAPRGKLWRPRPPRTALGVAGSSPPWVCWRPPCPAVPRSCRAVGEGRPDG